MVSARVLLVAMSGIALLGAGACAPLRGYQGYVVDADLVNSVQPGVDNRESVLATLGKPTLTSQFNQGEWYYVGRQTRNYAFNDPKAREQTTLRIRRWAVSAASSRICSAISAPSAHRAPGRDRATGPERPSSFQFADSIIRASFSRGTLIPVSHRISR